MHWPNSDRLSKKCVIYTWHWAWPPELVSVQQFMWTNLQNAENEFFIRSIPQEREGYTYVAMMFY